MNEQDVARLAVPDPGTELKYVTDAVSLIYRELDGRVPLIGFSGSPWTLATYMVEGGSSKTFARIKAMMYERPDLLHRILDVLTDSVSVYLSAQIAAGAQAVMIFDTWGGSLSPARYQEFSLDCMRRIVSKLKSDASTRDVPVILFTTGGGQGLESMADSGCDALGLDWTTDLADARARVGDRVALQGNLDPCVLYASPDVIEKEVERVLASYGKGNGHVFNLGHGIHPEINPEHAAALIEAVHNLSRPYHQ